VKTALFWGWTVFCVVATVLCSVFLPSSEKKYSGSNITFLTDDKRQFTINAEKVVIEAASNGFFVFQRAESGEALVGIPTEKPLGWSGNTYYKLSPTQVSGGTWIVEKGSGVTLHLSGMGNATVQESFKEGSQAELIVLLLVVGLLIWFLGLWGFFGASFR